METWHYHLAADLDRSFVERLRAFPRQPDMLVYGLRGAAALLLRGWLALYHGLRITGREHLPRDRSFVMVANHSSHLDVLCLLAALPLSKVNRAFPAAAQDYFFISLPRMLAAVVATNALPFDRKARFRSSLSVCGQVLDEPGNVLILFPEGTRSPSGELGEFKPGIGALVAGRNVPVVPCYLEGAHAAWPKGAWFPRPRRLHLRIGPPLVFADRGHNKDAVLRICRDVRDAVKALAKDC